MLTWATPLRLKVILLYKQLQSSRSSPEISRTKRILVALLWTLMNKTSQTMSRLGISKKIKDLRHSKPADFFQSQSTDTNIPPWVSGLKCQVWWATFLWTLVPSLWCSTIAEEVPAALQEGRLSDYIPLPLLNWYRSGRKNTFMGKPLTRS